MSVAAICRLAAVPTVEVWLPGLVTVTAPVVVWPKSALKVVSTPVITAGSVMMSPSSRLSFRELAEKFSDPRKILAVAVP